MHYHLTAGVKDKGRTRTAIRAIAFVLLLAFVLPGCIVPQTGNPASTSAMVAETQSMHVRSWRGAAVQGLFSAQMHSTVMRTGLSSRAAATPSASPTQASKVQKGYINAKSLNLRSKPNRESAIIKEYSKGQAVEIIGTDGDWYQVRVAGKTGYMLKKYVSLASSAQTTPSKADDSKTVEARAGYVNARSLNMRTRPDRKSTVIKEYKNGQAVEIIGEDGDWYKVVVAGATGYMLKEYVSSGKAPASTQKPSTRSSNKTAEPDTAAKKEKATPAKTPKPEAAPTRQASGMVWIPTKGGKKYHSHSSCSGMISPREVTVEEAKDLGFTACKKCYK